ncbi:MAG: carbohydrate kinase [Actinomycetota bacterium]
MLLVVGEALVDLVIAPDGSVEAALGGAPFNTARAASRLGAEVTFYGALSTDRFGTQLDGKMAADGVDTLLAPRVDAPTTLAAAEIDDGGAATYRFYLDGTSAPQLADWPAMEPNAVFTGGLGLVLEPMATTVVNGLEHRRPNSLVMIDVNARPLVVTDRERYVERVSEALRRADVVKVSDEDLAFLGPDVSVRSILDGGAGAVIVTAGSAPTGVFTSDRSLTVDVPAPPGPVVDTIGAGDTFGGGVIAELLRAKTGPDHIRAEDGIDRLRRAVEFGTRAAGVVVTRRGADPPTRDEL